jgi:hypothetical protein
MTFTPSQCVCGLYEWQICSRQPCARQAKSIPSTPPTMNPVYNPPPTGNIPLPSYMALSVPVGCICPPGANKECENPTCPRKPKV